MVGIAQPLGHVGRQRPLLVERGLILELIALRAPCSDLFRVALDRGAHIQFGAGLRAVDILCAGIRLEQGLILAPLLMPVAESYGFNKVLFGIIMILNLEIGFLTPPVGLNLIVAMSAFRQPFGLLVKAALPYIALMRGCLALVIWQPWIAMFLVDGKFP